MARTQHLAPDSLRAGIARRVEDKKPLSLSLLAKEFGISELGACRALPATMRDFLSPSYFTEVWNEITLWPSSLFFIENMGSILEIKGKIPAGKTGYGYFNLETGGSIGGHLKLDDLKTMAFLSMPFMGLESLSIHFFNTEGELKFSIYAGRGEDRQIIPKVRESFERLRAKAKKDIV